MRRGTEVDPVPEGAHEELLAARSAAVDAVLEAERLEADARKARRRATARSKHYENLLLIHGGQMTLPYGEEGSD